MISNIKSNNDLTVETTLESMLVDEPAYPEPRYRASGEPEVEAEDEIELTPRPIQKTFQSSNYENNEEGSDEDEEGPDEDEEGPDEDEEGPDEDEEGSDENVFRSPLMRLRKVKWIRGADDISEGEGPPAKGKQGNEEVVLAKKNVRGKVRHVWF